MPEGKALIVTDFFASQDAGNMSWSGYKLCLQQKSANTDVVVDPVLSGKCLIVDGATVACAGIASHRGYSFGPGTKLQLLLKIPGMYTNVTPQVCKYTVVLAGHLVRN